MYPYVRKSYKNWTSNFTFYDLSICVRVSMCPYKSERYLWLNHFISRLFGVSVCPCVHVSVQIRKIFMIDSFNFSGGEVLWRRDSRRRGFPSWKFPAREILQRRGSLARRFSSTEIIRRGCFPAQRFYCAEVLRRQCSIVRSLASMNILWSRCSLADVLWQTFCTCPCVHVSMQMREL